MGHHNTLMLVAQKPAINTRFDISELCTVESRKFEVFRSRASISNYQQFELYGDRHKNIQPPKLIISIFSIKHKFWVRKSNFSLRRFFYAPKPYVIKDEVIKIDHE